MRPSHSLSLYPLTRPFSGNLKVSIIMLSYKFKPANLFHGIIVSSTPSLTIRHRLMLIAKLE